MSSPAANQIAQETNRPPSGGTKTGFDPAKDSAAFRKALGEFTTGVTAITAPTADGPVAIVANSFASVSLDPPLVLWSPAKASSRFGDFAEAPRFGIHILAADQRPLCKAIVASKFALRDTDTAAADCGVPLVAGAVASFICTQVACHDAGDHVVIIGEVTEALHQGGTPLVFHAGRYGGFAPDTPQT